MSLIVEAALPFDAKTWLDELEAGGMTFAACYRAQRLKDSDAAGVIRWIECEWTGGPAPDRSRIVAEVTKDRRRFEAVYLEIARRNGRWCKRVPDVTERKMEAMGYV